MTKIQKFFKDTTTILLAESQRSSNIEHRASIGINREFFIENFIKKSFPSKFVIGSGEILDSTDTISKQADIVIYDEFMPVFNYSATKHFLSEGVFAHIEVKSNLTTAELGIAIGVTDSIKKLKKEIKPTMVTGKIPPKIFSCVFAYQGVKKETLKEEILKKYSSEKDIDNVIDIICVLNEYTMIKNYNPVSKKTEVVFLESKEDSLMIFFTKLFDAMYKNWEGRPDINKYLGNLTYPNF